MAAPMPVQTAAAGASDTDTLSLLQNQLDHTGSLLHSTLGLVWQQAAPLASAAEGGDAAASGQNAALAQAAAKELGDSMARLEETARRLEVERSQAMDVAQLEAELEALGAQAGASAERLRQLSGAAQGWLAEVRGALADVQDFRLSDPC